MESIDTIIEVINKICIKNNQFKTSVDPTVIAHEYFEQQGVRNVIQILEAIRDRTIDVREIMRKE